MPPAAFIGSTINSGDGAVVLEGSADVLINGVGAARVGDAVEAHSPGTGLHLTPVIAQGSLTVKIDGIPAAYVGCLLNCGHIIITGSPDVEIGA